ncbi:MAG: hypothetical protein K2X73_04640 [Sphingomonas sp.]|uniref:helix-turn-helix domain-containing protein n=1 Tax=Sphingomonas sp. TaxID=28214 RepID=UPI0025FBFA73|nr:helix-turn-helix domain-containing protein [Sphingomonas sp.]MBX9881241.1 hypothetical protein [Sphingomonas sp.]
MTLAERSRMIAERVAAARGVSIAEMFGPARHTRAAEARSVAAWVIRWITGQGSTPISRTLNRDHSTIIAALNRVDRRRAAEPDFATTLDQLVDQIREDL